MNGRQAKTPGGTSAPGMESWGRGEAWRATPDRKSTRLNSSHLGNSYSVFCLKKNRHTERPHALALLRYLDRPHRRRGLRRLVLWSVWAILSATVGTPSVLTLLPFFFF